MLIHVLWNSQIYELYANYIQANPYYFAQPIKMSIILMKDFNFFLNALISSFSLPLSNGKKAEVFFKWFNWVPGKNWTCLQSPYLRMSCPHIVWRLEEEESIIIWEVFSLSLCPSIPFKRDGYMDKILFLDLF